jgi:hypothetical protein
MVSGGPGGAPWWIRGRGSAQLLRTIILGLGLALGCQDHSVLAQTESNDLSSINTDQLARFFAAVEQGTGPVTVVAFGDSLQAPWRSFGRHLGSRLQDLIGRAGIGLASQTPNLALSQLLGEATITGPDTNWWMGYYLVPANGAVIWSNQTHTSGSLLADQAGLHYMAAPGGGAFSLSVSSNGGPWTTAQIVDAVSPQPEGRLAQVSLPLGYYRVRADGLSGTNRILGPELVNSQSRGLKTVYMARDGCNLNQILSVPSSVLGPVLTHLQPTLIHWHMKEYADIGSTSLSNRLRDLEALWRSAAPQADVIYLGTPYEQRDTTNRWSETQNRIVRQAAQRDHRTYLDCMTPFVSYDFMVNNGYLDDGVHPSNLCYTRMAEIAWKELGFFALKVDRRLRGRALEGRHLLEWPSVAGITYTLESSPDLSAWWPRLTVAGDGSWLTCTNTLASPALFRLRLSSP